ncbi:hypothetical protein NC652_024669 [Populus alba x Populus x berolinensis]|nr:hypothetical protein NC652_024669 [Populus alba x Populus x berolinensis]
MFFPLCGCFVECWCGSYGEWRWLLDEEDDELKMALAVLSSSPAFIGQRQPCAGNGRL